MYTSIFIMLLAKNSKRQIFELGTPSNRRFRPIQTANLSETVADQIVEAIGSKRILSGQRLFETDLAQQLSVSRVPVREAFLVLQSQGVMRTTPRRGSHIIDLDETWARETYEARTALETICFQRAAKVIRTNDEAMAIVDANIAAIRSACKIGDRAAINRADLAFHTAIYQMSDSPLLQTLWNAMARHVMIMFGLVIYRHNDFKQIIDEHVELGETLINGSTAEIAATVARHVIGPFDSKALAEKAYSSSTGT